jgi:hypothetical protein
LPQCTGSAHAAIAQTCGSIAQSALVLGGMGKIRATRSDNLTA